MTFEIATHGAWDGIITGGGDQNQTDWMSLKTAPRPTDDQQLRGSPHLTCSAAWLPASIHGIAYPHPGLHPLNEHCLIIYGSNSSTNFGWVPAFQSCKWSLSPCSLPIALPTSPRPSACFPWRAGFSQRGLGLRLPFIKEGAPLSLLLLRLSSHPPHPSHCAKTLPAPHTAH